jgi:phosphatidylserine/phosphatidylglycerophosphate/cardiolipin synthase-like enzyme
MGRLFNLSLQHRRMHNKLFLADNSMAIVGGRNLGDEYFDAEPNLNFTDIDMLSVGPVAEQLGHSFDQYWNSALSKPIADFLSSKPAKDLRASRRAWKNRWPKPANRTTPCTTVDGLPDRAAPGHLAQRADLGLEPGAVGRAEQGAGRRRAGPATAADQQLAPELRGVSTS